MYRYTGNLQVSDLEDNELSIDFTFDHEDQLPYIFVKQYAIDHVFNNKLAPSSMCRIGPMGYKMEVVPQLSESKL